MSPWAWLAWSVVALVILFVASAAIAGIVDDIRKPKPCERCGAVPGQPEDYRRNLN